MTIPDKHTESAEESKKIPNYIFKRRLIKQKVAAYKLLHPEKVKESKLRSKERRRLEKLAKKGEGL